MEHEPGTITISIYQNADHVSGILQQVFRQPLVVDESRERQTERSDSAERSGKAGANVEASGTLPFVGSVAVGADIGGTANAGHSVATGMRSTQSFLYSQATYLYLVRDELKRTGQLKSVTSSEDARELKSGDFVEYQAAFRPNEINTLLDILTPDLIAEIASFRIRRQGLELFDVSEYDHERLTRMVEKNHAKAEITSSLAREVARAVRADFRSEKTREFYGVIGREDDQVTAITICDNEHFVVNDEDRILDGVFTVLGKVISPTEADVPILERNKILERFRPEAVDKVLEVVQEAVEAQTEPLGTARAQPDLAPGDLIDLDFASRISGISFRVVPIAIYA